MFTEPPALRLALALGDQELEQRLRPALDAAPDLQVTAQCLAADQLVAAVEARQVDVVVVAWGLHRLSERVLAQIERARLPVLLLVPDADDERWLGRASVVLPVHVEAGALREAIQAAARGERPQVARPPTAAEPAAGPAADPETREHPCVIAVAGGSGSPGRTTVALNLATALGAVASTVLVDADFASPSVAAYLDCDPSRNLCTLTHAARETPHSWGRLLDDELQPLHPRSRRGLVVCGLPKREMRSSVSPAVLEQLASQLTLRYRYVVIDVGADLIGLEPVPTLHRSALLLAQHVLVVTGSDLVGLWHARTALDQLGQQLEIGREQTSLVINRHDPRHHHTRAEIEWHLGVPAAAVVPYDYAGQQRAVSNQYPVVVDPRSRAGRALLGLAERVHHGRVRLPSLHERPERRTAWAWARQAAHAAGGRLRAAAGRASSSALSANRGRGEAW